MNPTIGQELVVTLLPFLAFQFDAEWLGDSTGCADPCAHGPFVLASSDFPLALRSLQTMASTPWSSILDVNLARLASNSQIFETVSFGSAELCISTVKEHSGEKGNPFFKIPAAQVEERWS